MKRYLYIFILVFGIVMLTGCSTSEEESVVKGEHSLKCTINKEEDKHPLMQEIEILYKDENITKQTIHMELDLKGVDKKAFSLYKASIDKQNLKYRDVAGIGYDSLIDGNIIKSEVVFVIDKMTDKDIKNLGIQTKSNINKDYEEFVKEGYSCTKK